MNEKIPLKYAILLTGQSRRAVTRDLIVKADGDISKYDNLCEGYDNEFAPENRLQTCLVHEMVDLRWRLEHVRGYISRWDNSLVPRDRPTAQALRELGRYERRLLKQYDEIFADLCLYQRQSKAA